MAIVEVPENAGYDEKRRKADENNSDARMKRQVMGREVIVPWPEVGLVSERGSVLMKSSAGAGSGCWSGSSEKGGAARAPGV
ncbi:MAG: hypothetical protein EOL86_12735 [Deltaproteobacteria bacterium]|nr:hypothetical protein [Deltaproteobacteria bacterium]